MAPPARLQGWRLWFVCLAFVAVVAQLPIVGFVALWWWGASTTNHRVTPGQDRVVFERWFATWMPADLDRTVHLGRTLREPGTWVPLSAREVAVDRFTWVTPRHLRIDVVGEPPDAGLVQRADDVTIEWRSR